MKSNNPLNVVRGRLVVVLTASILLGGQLPAYSQTTGSTSSSFLCRIFPSLCAPSGGGGGGVRPVPVPALGLGLIGLGMGLVRKRRHLKSSSVSGVPKNSVTENP
jgi:hypothetical protein